MLCGLLLLCTACAAPHPQPGESAAPSPTFSAPAAEEIRLGVCAELSGINSAEGLALEKGVQLAAKKINEAGGVDGKVLRVITYDVGARAAALEEAAAQLIARDGVCAVITACGYPLDLADLGGTEVAQLDCSAKYEALSAAGYFSLGADEATLLHCLEEEICRAGSRQMGVLYCADEKYSQPLERFLEDLGEAGVQVAATETFQAGDMDFIAQIDRVLAENPSGVVCYGPAAETAILVKQLRARGFRKTIYGTENMGSLAVTSVAGESADGVVFAAGSVVSTSVADIAVISNTEMQEEILGEYVRQYGELPRSILAFKGYDCVLAVTAALGLPAETGKRESLPEGLRRLEALEGSSGLYDLSQGSGIDTQAPDLYVIEDQTFQKR